ncbi:hypothetical protein AAFF_G00242530 [Aldrovandia affinis]|uniref:Uncharacterized protein n=1 Tax=Aldrovandia affinis TaxID=143900 RepID=A0AAD7RED9_9TELE|nr:hypothetical protein AAFF_G00242530 [Aldrovandia affinis]
MLYTKGVIAADGSVTQPRKPREKIENVAAAAAADNVEASSSSALPAHISMATFIKRKPGWPKQLGQLIGRERRD